MHPYEVLLAPIISEKSQMQAEDHRVSFEVARAANKAQIKQAVEIAFPDVRVLAVNTMVVRGKAKKRGVRISQRPDWKKAIVTLRPGDRIEFFEGV